MLPPFTSQPIKGIQCSWLGECTDRQRVSEMFAITHQMGGNVLYSDTFGNDVTALQLAVRYAHTYSVYLWIPLTEDNAYSILNSVYKGVALKDDTCVMGYLLNSNDISTFSLVQTLAPRALLSCRQEGNDTVLAINLILDTFTTLQTLTRHEELSYITHVQHTDIPFVLLANGNLDNVLLGDMYPGINDEGCSYRCPSHSASLLQIVNAWRTSTLSKLPVIKQSSLWK